MAAGPNKRLLLEDVKQFRIVRDVIPQTPPGGVVIKVHYAGVCHSEVMLSQSPWHPKLEMPRVLGHEVSGTVYSIGAETAKARPDIAVGDRVIVFPWGNCHDCVYCKNDVPHCEKLARPGRHSPIGYYVYGIWRDGGFQQYMAVDYPEFLVPVPDSMSMDQACVVPCSGITAYHAVESMRESVDKALSLTGQAQVGLFGAGGLALWAIQIIKALYPRGVRIVAVDINEDKLEDARRHGADITHKWSSEGNSRQAVGGLMKACGSQPYLDGAIDFTGVTSVIERIYSALNVGATLSLVGLMGKGLPPIPVASVVQKCIRIKGNLTGSISHCRQLLQLIEQGKVKPPPLSEICLEDVERTILSLQQGKQRGRAVVNCKL